MSSHIQKHNKKVLKEPVDEPNSNTCNCRGRNKDNCPLDGNCLATCIVYKATVNSDLGEMVYFGLSEGTFKSRLANHNKSFNRVRYMNDTNLSKYIWSLKESDVNYNIKWTIAAKCFPYVCGSRKCDLCLSEKLLISKADPNICLNTRAELISKCRHSNKFKLKNLKDI